MKIKKRNQETDCDSVETKIVCCDTVKCDCFEKLMLTPPPHSLSVMADGGMK